MKTFKNTEELEKRNRQTSLEAFPTKKISASELKLIEIKLNEESFWGIAVKSGNKEVLIGCHPSKNHFEESVIENASFSEETKKKLFVKPSEELFIERSKNFIKHSIEELYMFGLFKLVLSDKGFICLDTPIKPNCSYSLLTTLKLFNAAEEYKASQEGSPKRLEKFWLAFCEDLLFFQEVGPVDPNEEKDKYLEVIQWAESCIKKE
jgi:hypothetical protein